MKKFALGLLGFLLFAGSLFAITLEEISSAIPPYPRAYIKQMDVRDANEWVAKVNSVTYQYWDADYPYITMRYNGKVESWWYTTDYNNFYTYDEPYPTYWDQYIDQNNLSITYIYVYMEGYSTSAVAVEKYDTTTQQWNSENIFYVGTTSLGWRVYENNQSTSVSQYRVVTTIQATDGTAYLHNNVTIDRDAQ